MSPTSKLNLQAMLPGGVRDPLPVPAIREETIHDWVAQSAHPLHSTNPDGPVTELAPIGEAINGSVVVGLGETVRAGREAIHTGQRVIRYLVQEQGFRALAFQDDKSVISELDAHITGGEGDLTELMSNMWNPWQAVEVREALEWLREFNIAHPEDQVRLFGLAPAGARPEYYDQVIEALREANSAVLADVAALYGTIRTAHDVNEHVQISRGTHPGGSYTDRAREARDLVAAALPGPSGSSTRSLTELIVDFHGSSAAGDYPKVDMTAEVADTITDYHYETFRKIIFWEGLVHTMVDKTVTERAPAEDSVVGTKLYHRLGNDYVSLLIAFSHGEIHDGDVVPRPQQGTLDAQLSVPGLDKFVLNLSAPRTAEIADWLRGPHRMRIISGIYDPNQDEDHYASFPMLDDMFAAIIRIGEITPSQLLSEE